MKIQDVMRAMSVKRFHIVETVRNQTLAEHLFIVSMIGVAICEGMNVEPDIYHKVSWYGLNHDIHEIIEGDIPTPTKEKWGIDNGPPGSIPQEVYEIVKCADLIADAWFCSQYSVGRHAKLVAVDCVDRCEQYIESREEELKKAALDVWSDITVGGFTK